MITFCKRRKKRRKWSGLSDDIRPCSTLSWSEPSSIRSLTCTAGGFTREWLWGGQPWHSHRNPWKAGFPVVVGEEVSVWAAWQGIRVAPSDKQKGHGTTARNRFLLTAAVSLQSLQAETRSTPLISWAGYTWSHPTGIGPHGICDLNPHSTLWCVKLLRNLQ